MSETPEPDRRRDALQFAAAFASGLAEDLSALIGTQARLDSPELSVVEATAAVAAMPPVTHARCRRRDGGDDVPHLLLPLDAAITLAGLLMGHAKDRIEELKREAIAPEMLDALSEVMNLTAAVLSRSIGEEAGLNSGLQQGDTQPRPTPAEGEPWLPAGSYRQISHTLALPDHLPARIDVLLPASFAEQWFRWPEEPAPAEDAQPGASEANSVAAGRSPAAPQRTTEQPSGEGVSLGANDRSDAEGAAPPATSEDAPAGAVVFIDAAPPDPDRGQEIEAALGRSCHWLEPAALNADAMEDLAQAAAIVIAFDLGGRCGLDLLEAFSRDERTHGVRMAIATATPTRGSVAAALRAGARSVLFQPYDAEEIDRRLFRGTA